MTLYYIDGGGSKGNNRGRYGYVKNEKDEFNEDKHWVDLEAKIYISDNLTNNEAGYRALIKCLESIKQDEKNVYILSDSLLIVNQFNGEWRIREQKLRNLCEIAKSIATVKRVEVKLVWISQKFNKMGLIIKERMKNDKISS